MRLIFAHIAMLIGIILVYVALTWLASVFMQKPFGDLVGYTALFVVAALETRILLRGIQ